MRILVTGASGQLGSYLLRELAGQAERIAWSNSRDGDLFGVPLFPFDLSNIDALQTAFRSARPDAVIHCAALARVADCFRDPPRAQQANVAATAALAAACADAGTRLVFVSTDLVFDGERGSYREADAPAPLSSYGRTKQAAEAAAFTNPNTVVARLSLLYGRSLNGQSSFFEEQLSALQTGRPLKLFTDEWRTPLDLTSAARALSALALSEWTGLVHVGGPERLSRFEMGQRLANKLGVAASMLVPVRRADVPAAEPRPRDTSLDSARWRSLFSSLPWPHYLETIF